MAAEAKGFEGEEAVRHTRFVDVDGDHYIPKRLAKRNPAKVWLSGSLKKKGKHLMSWWSEYWFVLYKETRELRYYSSVARATWTGQNVNIPIDERGCFKIDCITDIREAHPGKYGATRFDLVVRTMGNSHYPDEFSDDFQRPWFQYHDRVIHLVAPNAKSKQNWVDALRALKQYGGAAGDAKVDEMLARRRTDDPLADDDGVDDYFPDDHRVRDSDFEDDGHGVRGRSSAGTTAAAAPTAARRGGRRSRER